MFHVTCLCTLSAQAWQGVVEKRLGPWRGWRRPPAPVHKRCTDIEGLSSYALFRDSRTSLLTCRRTPTCGTSKNGRAGLRVNGVQCSRQVACAGPSPTKDMGSSGCDCLQCFGVSKHCGMGVPTCIGAFAARKSAFPMTHISGPFEQRRTY